ncbi:MAG TPA: DUF3866 family protein [Solirubrobacteraceae bacterium]|jgi:hypothetical protein|nr:DUF3866 family protein [Solirubrobacteraceae bacterium]
MLKLRKATVVEVLASHPGEQELVVELADGSRRAAISDVSLHGACQAGDELIVNVQALDLGLGSGGFDVVHVNLTRVDEDPAHPEGPADDARVMKLNYTSLQHAVQPVEGETLELPLERPVAVLGLHGQLAAVAWAFAQQHPQARLGFVQTPGGALPGGRSRTVELLRERGLLAGHITAGAAYGGEQEAITTAGAIHHGIRTLDWDAAVCGPGPGIVGSRSPLGHGGLHALDSAHAALALGAPTLLVARMSSADSRPRHRGVSHHTLTVLDLLLQPVTVALPAGIRSPAGADLRATLGSVFGSSTGRGRPQLALDVDRPTDRGPAGLARHDWRRAPIDLPAYLASGLPAVSMGRELVQDPLFFAAALAGGAALAELCELAGAHAEAH